MASSPPRPHLNVGMMLAMALWLLVQPTSAWLIPTRRRTNHPRKQQSLMATVDIPVDTFGDVNRGYLDDEGRLAYYNSDAAQTIFPYLDHWRIQPEDGSLIGIVYNHPTYEDGEAIATSPLDEELSDEPEAEGIITTVTGSQYLLGNELVVSLRDWKVTSEGGLQGIVTHSHPHIDLKEGQRITTSPTDMEALENTVVTTESGSHYFLLEPLVFPLLEQWKRLEGGSIAGFVYHHQKIADGELITTTPLVELDESQDGMILVTTASGSQYQLGEAEPAKQFADEYAQAQQVQDMEEALEVDDGIYYGEEEEEEIPTIHLPSPPKSNPLGHIFSAAFQHHKKIVEQHNNRRPKDNQANEPLVLMDGSTESTGMDGDNATSWSNQTAWQH